MRIVGLVGGTGWISTVEYYRYINEEVNRRLGGLNFAECVIYSLDFGKIDALKRSNREPEVFNLILDAAKKLEGIGVQGLAICANTLHKFVDQLEPEITVPLIHIATATARCIKDEQLGTIGLLGTKPTMELEFYKKKLGELGIETLVPGPEDRDFIEHAILEEILKGLFKTDTKERFLRIMSELQQRGAEGIVLGCTEIPLLVREEDADLPLFNTTFIHARAIVDFALGGVEERPVC